MYIHSADTVAAAEREAIACEGDAVYMYMYMYI